MKKKYFSGLLVLAMMSISFLPSVSAAEFTDIGGKQSRAAIEFLQNSGVVEGYKDGTFGVEKKISRAEFLKIVMETATLPKQTCTKTELKDVFPDVSTDEWFAQTICDAKKTGIVKGHSDGLFRPYNTIELAEAAKIVALSQEVAINLADDGAWYQKYLDALQADKVITNEEKNTPAQQITRGEMAQMSYRLQTGIEIVDEDAKTLPVINSCEDLSHQLVKGQLRQNGGNMGSNSRVMNFGLVMDEAVAESAPIAMQKSAVTTSSDASDTASSDFSTTNIQEQGVDEADIVKNDGSHIFYARGEDVRIVKAYPVENMKEESKISVSGMRITELFLEQDTLTVLGTQTNTSGGGIGIEPYASKMAADSYYYGGSQNIEMRVFNVADRSNPKEIRKFSLDGNLVSSRKIGDIVYLVSQKYLPSQKTLQEKDLPQVLDGDQKISIAPGCGQIEYFPNFKNNQLLTVSAIDTADIDAKPTLKNILGAGNTVYASLQNLFVVQQNSHQVYRLQTILPPQWGWDWDNKSDIYKFSLDGLNVAFEAKGVVDGRVLNQYSMSEYENNFRIATQKGQAWGQKQSENMVTILDENLQELSKVGKIAPGENLKSARFMGQRAFLVTFKTVDPLFVVDLDPKDPKVLGELKIPGWSDYLHPIDDNYLIGFGKEVDETIDADKIHSDNAVYYTAVLGMKLAIFDVSDLTNPKEIHKTVIGDRGTESEILHNPKALFYDGNRKLIGFPVTIQTKSSYSKDCKIVDGAEVCEANHSGDNFETTFSGAQVYNFSVDDGFSLKGQVTHFPKNTKNWWDQNYRVERVVRIGENFYSLSKGMVKGLGAHLEEKEDVSFLGDIACQQISDEATCRGRSDCEAKYIQPECPEGKLCIQVMEFSQCVSK